MSYDAVSDCITFLTVRCRTPYKRKPKCQQNYSNRKKTICRPF